ncbi:MAG: 50S ribosomal protein L3 N(5)-glutamine methyltransferase [Gammaproteobacteria bacterium]|nr:MAG: 50S ribosomal protein L3 N(5)-glutamine methyltransferase [Gammaproteobacteria bacterium]UTW41533.1 50S ribosomal protein L3 N(5)-glutamine methyltransferase [bacterium SCSIO 12844]
MSEHLHEKEHLIDQLITVRDYLRWATSRFEESELYYGHGCDSVWDEAVHLVLQALYLPLDIDQRILDSRLTTIERERVIEWIYRRVIDRVPLPYITNKAYFANKEFYVDQRVLIPRSPIGELIRNDFQPWLDANNVHRVLDLCTGSGCIGIASADVFTNAEVVLSDISTDALEVAKRNIKLHQLDNQVDVVQSDLFANLGGERFDLIVSNPPYVDRKDLNDMPLEYHKEPQLGLEAGQDGLDIVKRILRQAVHHLNENGILVVEVGNSQYALAEQFPSVPFTWITFEDGGDGVFLLTADELVKYHETFLKG